MLHIVAFVEHRYDQFCVISSTNNRAQSLAVEQHMTTPKALLGITGLMSLSSAMLIISYMFYGLNSYIMYGVLEKNMDAIDDEHLDDRCACITYYCNIFLCDLDPICSIESHSAIAASCDWSCFC